jgi:hypothetical protein
LTDAAEKAKLKKLRNVNSSNPIVSGYVLLGDYIRGA